MLINKVKPEILEFLENETKPNYGASYRSIIYSFKKCSDYRQLTIDEVDSLLIYLPESFRPNGRSDFYYGGYLLKKEYQI